MESRGGASLEMGWNGGDIISVRWFRIRFLRCGLLGSKVGESRIGVG